MSLSLLVDLTPMELWLAAGRFLLMVSGTLLGAKHLAWLIRTDTDDAGAWPHFRHIVGMVAGFVIGAVYAVQIFTEPQGVVLTQGETVIIVWAFAVLMSVVVSKSDAR